jgi:hypothetical protein
MKKNNNLMKTISWLRLAAATMIAVGVLCPSLTQAQVPARFYWKTLSDANAVPLIFESINGNTNPFDPSHQVVGEGNLSATLTMMGYARTFSLFDRGAMAAFIQPMGHITAEASVAGKTSSESAGGYGDPMIEFNINVIGPRAQKNIPDSLRYEPGFSVDLLADLALPVGEYDSSQSLNLGQNRWYGRFGLPIIWQLGPWVPGRRTTLEFLPAVWLFGANNDYNGQKMETDPIFQLDAHLTHDFAESFWGSLDAAWFTGGQSSINGVSGDKLTNLAFGPTLGYTINSNLNLTFGYKATVNDKAPEDIRMDGFMISLVFGWHPIIEGSRRLQE